MKALLHVGYGDPSRSTRIGEREKPVAGEHDVLVRVLASSINSGDWRAVYSSPFFIRFISGIRKPRDPALGGDVAGIVEAVGAARTDLQPGDEVFGIRGGALAEYVAGRNFVRKPSNLDFVAAAAVPIAGVTALQAVQKYGQLRPGQRVLVNGAGGGVGTFAVQIAAALGGEVTAVTSSDRLDMVRSLGAAHVVDYTRDDFARQRERYDLVIDVGGNRSVRDMRRVLAAGGRIVMVAAGKGGFGTLGRLVGGVVRKRLGQPVIFFYAAGPYEEQLTTLREMIEAGKVRPVIDRTFVLDDAAAAIRYVATERSRGKVAILIDPGAAESADARAARPPGAPARRAAGHGR